MGLGLLVSCNSQYGVWAVLIPVCAVYCLAGCAPRCVFWTGGITARCTFASLEGTWGLDRLRNPVPALCKGPRR